MMSTFHTEQIYPKKWNDNIIIAVYANEACKHYDKTIAFNANASKKALLRKLACAQNFSTDIMLAIDNIIDLTNIEAFTQERKVILTTETSTITAYSSKYLIDVLGESF